MRHLAAHGAVTMRFDAPLWLAAGAAVVIVIALVLARRERHRKADIERFGEPTLLARSGALPAWRARVAAGVLLLVAVAAIAIALARPQWGETRAQVRRTSRDILFVLDLSRSMNARDGAPTRLDAARAAARAIADSLPHDRVGLEVFGGNAFLQLPLTTDHGTFERFLDAVSTEDIPDPATDIEGAAELAVATYARDGGPGAHIVVVLSDGESTRGSIGDAAKALAGATLHVFAVGVGSAAGGPVPNTPTDPRPHRDWTGREVVSHLDEGNLDALVHDAGGVAVHWTGDASVRPLVGAMRRLSAGTVTSSERGALTDRFAWALAAALVALVLESLVGDRVRRMAPVRDAAPVARRVAAVVIVALGLTAALGARGVDGRRAAQAMELYRAGRYREALDVLRALSRDARRTADTDARAAIDYDIGNTLYRLAQFDDAVASYRAALAGPPDLRHRAYFNLGDTYMHIADEFPDKRPSLHAAINAFTEALVLAPSDGDAKWNLELAERRLSDEETRFGGGRRRHADWGGGNLTKSGYAGAPQNGAGATQGGGFGNAGGGESSPTITESEARRMLDAVEKAQVTGQLPAGPRGTGATSHDKDW